MPYSKEQQWVIFPSLLVAKWISFLLHFTKKNATISDPKFKSPVLGPHINTFTNASALISLHICVYMHVPGCVRPINFINNTQRVNLAFSCPNNFPSESKWCSPESDGCSSLETGDGRQLCTLEPETSVAWASCRYCRLKFTWGWAWKTVIHQFQLNLKTRHETKSFQKLWVLFPLCLIFIGVFFYHNVAS